MATKEENQIDQNLKLIAKTSVIVFIGIFLSKVLTYLYRIIIARYFGPEVYGLFTLSLTITTFFITISAFGFCDGLTRFIPQLRAKDKNNEISYLIKKTAKVFLITGILSSLILFFLSDFIAVNIFHNPELSILLKIMSIGLIFSMFVNLFTSVLRGFEKIATFSFIMNIFQNFVRLVVLGILILIGFTHSTTVVWSFVIGSILTFFISSIITSYQIPKSKSIISNSNIGKEFTSYSIPLMFYGLFATIFYSIDALSIGFFKSAYEVGIYNAAVPIAILLGIFPEIFMQLFFPLINREYSNKNAKTIEQLSKQVTKWVFMIALPIFILVFFFPGAAINLLFGSEYLGAEIALRILLVGTFISAVFAVSVNLISMIGKSKLILFNVIFASILNLILNAILVPIPIILNLDNSNGLIGASLATLSSICFFNLLFIIETKKFLKFIPIRRKMITIALISIIPTISLFYLTEVVTKNLLSIITISSLFVLFYLFLLIISNSLDKNDWMIIKSFWRKVF